MEEEVKNNIDLLYAYFFYITSLPLKWFLKAIASIMEIL